MGEELPEAIGAVPTISQNGQNRQSSTAFRLSNNAGSAILAEECQGQTRKRKFRALPLRLDWFSPAKFYCALSQLPSCYPNTGRRCPGIGRVKHKRPVKYERAPV